jgi:hypothetical protein
MGQPMTDSSGRRHLQGEPCWCGYQPKRWFGQRDAKPVVTRVQDEQGSK